MLPKVRIETARKSYYFKGSKLLNDILNEVKDLNSVMFKSRTLEFYRSPAFELLSKIVAVFTLLSFF